MSFSHKNKRLKDEPEYWQAFLTTKKGKSISRLSTWKEVNLQFSFFSTPIWLERMVICSITLIMQLIARLFSFFAKKSSQIWNNFCIFAHGFEVLSLLFSDYKDTHFLWVIQTSEPFLFQNYVKSRLWIFTCETLVSWLNLFIFFSSKLRLEFINWTFIISCKIQ